MSGTPFRATEFDKKIGELIAIRRRMFGMSQKDLAKKIGITFQQIQKYEVAENRLSASRLFDIANAFEMSVGQLVDGTEQEYMQDPMAAEMIQIMYRKMSADQRRALLRVARTMTSV